MNINLEKAREYFSSYHEGTLEKGLHEAFERALRTDAQIQAEYRAFERLMSDLEGLKSPVPEPEFDLHEVISRRLDLHRHEQKRRTPVSLWGWFRTAALGGLATAALVLAVLQIQNGGSSKSPAMAGFGAPLAATERLELKSSQDGFRIEFSTKGEKLVTVRSSDGAVLEQKTVKAGNFISPLTNKNEMAALLIVEVQGEPPVLVALPGSKMQTSASGEGSVKEFALAMAGFYRQPVTLAVGEDIKLKWTLVAGEAVASAEKAFGDTKYSAQESPDGVISIQSN